MLQDQLSMATRNPFDLLGDDENAYEDIEEIAAAASAVPKPAPKEASKEAAKGMFPAKHGALVRVHGLYEWI